MTWPAAVTLAIALLGAVLGVMNTWNSINDRRVRLRVTPSWSIGVGFSGMSIEVVNLSAFAVTLSDVGFTVGRAKGPLPKRLPILNENTVSGPPLPHRLERREVATILFPVHGMVGMDIRKAYARTADGTITYGVSGALRQFIGDGCKIV